MENFSLMVQIQQHWKSLHAFNNFCIITLTQQSSYENSCKHQQTIINKPWLSRVICCKSNLQVPQVQPRQSTSECSPPGLTVLRTFNWHHMYLLRCLDAKLTASEVVVFMEMWASPANGLKSVIFSSTSEDKWYLEGCLLFFPWTCNPENATKFLAGDLDFQ